jgi:hypothetical protein
MQNAQCNAWTDPFTRHTSRYNLAMSEDIRQLRTAYNTHTQEAMDDCENQAQQQMAYAMGIMKLKRDLNNNPKATLDEFVNPHLFCGRPFCV